ncbi:MAG TPA: polymer-forming cytoskeletal protein [Vicinamibacterales bacterium]|nr:polymer-forming cytoskeletal protein [Vicinamibacterales bacterium]
MWKRDAMPKPANTPNEPLADAPTVVMSKPTPIETRHADSNVIMNLGKSMRIKGELSASEDMTLCGHMEGRVTLTDHTLTIGPEADIRAEIKASIVVIMGAVSGNVTATQKIDLRATGSVTGDIAAPRIVIADGGQLLGKVQITGENMQRPARTA